MAERVSDDMLREAIRDAARRDTTPAREAFISMCRELLERREAERAEFDREVDRMQALCDALHRESGKLVLFWVRPNVWIMK